MSQGWQSKYLGYFSFFFGLVILPCMLIWVLYQDKATLREPDFETMWGPAYDDIKICCKYSRIFYFIYYFRRTVFLCLGFFIRDSPIIQILGILYLNIFMTWYQGAKRPLIERFDNRLELTNEFFISICSILMMTFTHAVQDALTQYYYGWALVGTILLLCAVNLTIVIGISGK